MRTSIWLVLAAVLALVAAPLAAGQRGGAGTRGKGKAAPQSAKETVDAEVARMTSECKLTAEQQETLKEKAKAKVAALEAWDKENGEKLKAAEDAAKTARSSGTATGGGRKSPSEAKTLQDSREAAAAQAQEAMLAVLTPEQKAAWGGFQLYETTVARYRKANPTEDQVAKIKSLCVAACKQMGEVDTSSKKGKKSGPEIEGKLRWAIEEAVLTPEQKATAVRKPAGSKRGDAAQPATQAPAQAPAPAQTEAPK